MGRPRHYSSEVPERCQALIDMLSEKVEESSDPDGRWGGPLKTTFLVAMATPMLVLPIERLFKSARPRFRGVADDRDLDPALAGLVQQELGQSRSFGGTPFFEANQWSYVTETAWFDVGRDWPAEALEALALADAAKHAATAPASDVLVALRNALAHGGVTYLDRDGRHADFATNMLAFASFVRPSSDDLRLLRVSVPAFERFLSLWTGWLGSSGVLDKFAEAGPGHFQHAAE